MALPCGHRGTDHEGLGYLADALAARGFVAVAPGINAQYTLGAGEPASAVRTVEIVEHTLTRLEDGGLGVDAALADMSELVLVGHSVGGQDSGLMAAGRTSFSRPVAGVVMLQPALNDSAALPLVDVPTVVVLSECDGDGVGWAGSIFSEPTPPPGVQLGVVSAGEPVAPVPGPGPVPPAALQSSGMTLMFCPEGYYTPFAQPGTEPCHRPELAMMVGFPQTIAASWDAAGASLTLPVTVGPGDAARLRVLADFADERLTQPLRLRLSAGGMSTDADIALPEIRREVIDPFTVSFGLAMWSTFTLPVPDGASSVTVEVLGPAAGSVQVLSLGVLTPL